MRILFSLLFLVSIYSAISAQTIRAGGGFNVSNVRAENNDSLLSEAYLNKKAGHFGLNVEFHLKKNFYFETGFLYSTKGFSYNVRERHGSAISFAAIRQKLVYLDLPIQLAYKLKVSDQLKVFFSAGTYLGMLLSADTEKEGGNGRSISDPKIGNEAEDDLKPIDGGLVFGGGIESDLLRLGAYYDLGILDISPMNEKSFQMKNRVYRFSIALKLFNLYKD